MKDWWLNLSLREKQTVALGTLLVVIFIIYELIFASLSHATTTLRTRIHKNEKLLSWMQESDKRIQELQNHPVPTATNNFSSLLSRVQHDLNQTPLQKNVSQLQQADNDSIELHFQEVNFDNMMAWLIKICPEQQLTITDMFVKPGTAAGIVDVTLKLKTE